MGNSVKDVWENMVDTDQEPVVKNENEKKQPVDKKQPVNKKNDTPKKTKNTAAAKGEIKKLPVKKDSPPAKGQGVSKVPVAAGKQSIGKLKKFVKGAWSELKKVHWPNRRELVSFTGVVLVAVIFVAVLIFAVDSILGKLLEVIIPK